jgi:type IV pilus biogenesis protein CpaD/CtpE
MTLARKMTSARKSRQATPSAICLVVLVGMSLLTTGCSHSHPETAPTLPAGVSPEQAVTNIQNDSSKSPEQKVKEIDAIQRQYLSGQPPVHHKRQNSE